MAGGVDAGMAAAESPSYNRLVFYVSVIVSIVKVFLHHIGRFFPTISQFLTPLFICYFRKLPNLFLHNFILVSNTFGKMKIWTRDTMMLLLYATVI